MPEGEERLESWKEIAAYLGREVRTVQLWEKSEGLPVHRHQHARQGSVYAFKRELDAWREKRKNAAAASKPNRLWRILPAAGILLAISIGAFAFRGARPPAGDVPSSVAVLPFLDLSPQKDSEYFSDGLSEELIDALSRVPNLRVVARTSSFAFKGQNTDIREIGRKLNVTGIIEGSVRKSGDRLRITAQLNRVSDGYHLWSRTYDRQMRDVFSVQREISEAIAGELRRGKGSPQPRTQPTRDLEAYRLYQEGRFFFNKFEFPESNNKAIERYREAVARDPGFAAAWAGMADAYSYLAEIFALAPREVMPKARDAAAKALELDDSSAEAHIAIGIVRMDYDRDVEGGQREFLRAMQLNPGSAWARHWYAHSLEAQNRVEDGFREMQAALALDPLSIPINWDIAGELTILGRYDEALQHIRNDQDLFPGVPVFGSMAAIVNYRKGDLAAARAAVEALRKQPGLEGDPGFLALFAAQEARDGKPAAARAMVTQLEAMRKTRYVEPFLVIEPCKALHDSQCLATWLHRANEERSSFFVYRKSYAPFWGLDPKDIAEF